MPEDKKPRKSVIRSQNRDISPFVEGLFESTDVWVERPKELYLAIRDIQNEHIYSGFNSKKFHFPVAKPALDHIKKKLSEFSFESLNVSELETKLAAEIQACLDKINLLEEGVEQHAPDPNGSGTVIRKVTYPYDECIIVGFKFAEIMDDVFRFKAYKELNAVLKDEELTSILTGSLPLNEKIISLSRWDYDRTKKKLSEEEKSHEPTRTEISQAMRLPPYYQAITWKDFVFEELIADPEASSPDTSIMIPSFLPLDLNFFNKTRGYPIYPMGLIDFEHLYADAFKHTPKEFAIHDLKHAWDMQLFNAIALHNTGFSYIELYDQMDKISDFLNKKLEDLKKVDPDLHSVVELMLFELLHEEAHSLELGDMREGLEKKSMYGNYFLDRLKYKLGPFNFFGDEEGPKYAKLMSRFEEGSNTLTNWFSEVEKVLKIDVKDTNRATSTAHTPEKTGIALGKKLSQVTKEITIVEVASGGLEDDKKRKEALLLSKKHQRDSNDENDKSETQKPKKTR